MRRTKFAGILAALFIFGGSTILGATTPNVSLQNNANGSVTLKVQDISTDIYGIQIELTTKEPLSTDVVFEPKDKTAYSFTFVKDNKVNIYIASSRILNVGKEATLGNLLDMRNDQFIQEASYKVVDYFLTPTDTPNADVEYTEENTVSDEPQDTEDNESSGSQDNGQEPETPNKPSKPVMPVQPGDTDDDEDSSDSQGGTVQKPVEPEKPTLPTVEFTDTKGHWAASSIAKMAERGVLKGYEDGTFGPSKQITRAEFAAVVSRAFGFEVPVTSLPFTDTALGKWYTEPVGSLYKLGIITGRPDGTFGVNDSITNQEIAVMISRSLKVLMANLEVQRTYIPFVDESTISPFAQEAVKELYELGIISGMPDGTYQPKASSTRAQVAVIVDRILTMIETK